ncbi:MAG: hypothetical protein J3K34DRAFT_427092 [Monoraphidium minutum]|nr:MAG: hypothetical protein J3K34DRAFT_427092 [Monoraphidium minutum]
MLANRVQVLAALALAAGGSYLILGRATPGTAAQQQRQQQQAAALDALDAQARGVTAATYWGLKDPAPGGSSSGNAR